MTTRRRILAATGFAALLALTACSKNAGISAERTIKDELEADIGLGPLDPTCGQPDTYEAGATFTCTATTEDERVLEFLGKMTDEDTYSVFTSNLLLATDVVEIRNRAAELLGAEIGVDISPDDIRCPDEIVLLDDSGDFVCEITDPAAGEVYDLTISTGGIEPGVGVRELNFQIADEPK